MTSTYNTPENPQKSAENFAENRSRKKSEGAPNDTACENQNEPSLSARADRVVGWIGRLSSQLNIPASQVTDQTAQGIATARDNLRSALVQLMVDAMAPHGVEINKLETGLDALAKRVERVDQRLDEGQTDADVLGRLKKLGTRLDEWVSLVNAGHDKQMERLDERVMHVEQAGKMDEQRIDELSQRVEAGLDPLAKRLGQLDKCQQLIVEHLERMEKRVEQIGDLNRVTRVRLDVLNTRVAQLEGTHTGPGPTATPSAHPGIVELAEMMRNPAGTHKITQAGLKLKPTSPRIVDPRLDSPGVKCQSNAETAVRADVWK